MLRGPSVEALAGLRAQVGAITSLPDAGAVGQELFAVANILREEVALRRVLTDGAVPPEAKAGLATSVFGSRLRADTVTVVTDAVGRRWTSPGDLVTALGEAAVVGVVRSAGDQGRAVSDELFGVRELVSANPALRSALSDPARSTADRSALLAALLDGKVLDATRQLVEHAVLADTGSVDTTLDAYQKLAAAVLGESVAVVHTARELTDADQARLVAALGKQYSTTVHLHVVVDPALVGGLRVSIGDDVIDGSVSGRIDEARRRLAG